MKTILLATLLSFFSVSALGGVPYSSAKDKCKFMDEARQQIEANPYELAKSNVENNKIVFFSVGAGEAPVLPGFKKNEEFCINRSYKIEMIWVGGDVISCDGQKELAKEVLVWADKYNKQVKNLLLKLRKYKCDM